MKFRFVISHTVCCFVLCTNKTTTTTKKEFGIAADAVKHLVPKDDTFLNTGTFIGRHVFGYNVCKAKMLNFLQATLGTTMEYSDIWDILSWLTLDEHVPVYCKKRWEYNTKKRKLSLDIKRKIAYGLINIIDEWLGDEYTASTMENDKWHQALFGKIELVDKYYTPTNSSPDKNLNTNSENTNSNTNTNINNTYTPIHHSNSNVNSNKSKNTTKSNAKSRNSCNISTMCGNNYNCGCGKLRIGDAPVLERDGNGYGRDPTQDQLNLWVCSPEIKSLLHCGIPIVH